MKQLYLQLVAVAKEDYKALMEVFHLELVDSSPHRDNMVLARPVSADEDDQRMAQQQVLGALASALGPPFPEQRQRGDGRRHRYDDQRPHGSSHHSYTRRASLPAALPAPRRDEPTVGDCGLLFSPSTEDMRSKTGHGPLDYVPYEYDDLRRQTGSYDRDDSDDREERDGPCCDDDLDVREDSEEWRRMYENVSLAASSIRSSAEFTSKRR